MSANNISATVNSLKELNRDFEYLLKSTDDDNIKKYFIVEITKECRKSAMKKLFKILLIIAFVMSQVYVIPFLNWNASAIGRIVMIKMLKVWDWRYLYNVDCLVEKKVARFDLIQSSIDNIEDDCSFCENIGKNNFQRKFCR